MKISLKEFIKENNFSEWLLALTCFVCNISQMPELIGRSFANYACYAVWLAVFAFAFFPRRQKLRFDFRMFIPIGLFSLYSVIIFLIFRLNFFSSNLFQPICISVFVTVTSFLVGQNFSEGGLRIVSFGYITSAALVAFDVYYQTFRGVDWLAADGYLYASKNSASIIFAIAIVLSLFTFAKSRPVVALLLTAGFASVIFMTKSRASILSLMIIIVYIIIVATKHRFAWLAVMGVFVSVIFLDKDMYRTFVEQIFLVNRDADNITAITANRDIHFEYFLEHFGESWITGTGGTYLESFPLAALMSYGVIGSVPVFVSAVLPIVVSFSDRGKKDLRTFRNLVCAINLLMLINCLFEEQTPFGPGVKCYALWMLFGLYRGMRLQRSIENEQKASADFVRPSDIQRREVSSSVPGKHSHSAR